MVSNSESWDYDEPEKQLSWDDFVDRFRRPSSPEKTRVFRGHTDGTWLLEPTLQRLCQKEGLEPDQFLPVERRIFEEFKYLGHHYWDLDLTGGDEAWLRHFDALGWIQHYGGPTRCLDFSWSPFVAAYFAMEEAPHGKHAKDPAVIQMKIEPENQLLGWKTLELSWKQWQAIFQPDWRDQTDYKPPIDDYFYAVPRTLHERFARQQGVALVPVEVRKSLHELLRSKATVTRFRLNLQNRLEYLAGLEQMNITRANLFEGPDAWAKSLQRCAREVRARRDQG